MPDSALEPAERAFLQALDKLGVRYLIVGVSAASMQGARVATEDVSLADGVGLARSPAELGLPPRL
jgi:hypothetical protein